MRHTTLEMDLKESFNIKWHPEEFDAQLVSFYVHNGIFAPGWIADVAEWVRAIHGHANTARIKYKFVSVTAKELLMGMTTRQDLRCNIREDGIQLLIGRRREYLLAK
jgi:hypothetical protein